MKLDTGLAWNQTTAMLSANRTVVLTVAAVFFFLPNFALMLFLPPELATMQMGGGQPGSEQMVAILTEYLAGAWWAFVLIAVAQAIGTLGLMVLLSGRSDHTLGQALGIAAALFLPFIASQLLAGADIRRNLRSGHRVEPVPSAQPGCRRWSRLSGSWLS